MSYPAVRTLRIVQGFLVGCVQIRQHVVSRPGAFKHNVDCLAGLRVANEALDFLFNVVNSACPFKARGCSDVRVGFVLTPTAVGVLRQFNSDLGHVEVELAQIRHDCGHCC